MIKMTKKRVVWVLGVVLAVGLVSGGIVARASKKASVPEAKNAPVTLEFSPADLTRLEAVALRPRLRVSGSLQPLRQTVVKAKVSGEIKTLSAREGDAVAAGQILAQFDTADLETRLAEKIGNQESGRAQLALAEKNRANNQALLKQGFISQNAYDNAVSAYDTNRGTQQAWEAQARLARKALADATVSTPLAGIVAKRHVLVGERVSVEAPLFTVVDLGELELQAPMPAVDVPRVKPGMAVSLRVDGFGEESFGGRITRINPMAEPGTRSIMVYVSLANPGARLKAGMFANGEIELAATQPVPTLPMTAVRSENGENYAWLLEDGKLTRRRLALGQRDDTQGRVEVVRGVSHETWVLAGKFDLIKEGQAGKVKTEPLQPGPVAAR